MPNNTNLLKDNNKQNQKDVIPAITVENNIDIRTRIGNSLVILFDA